MNKRIIANIVWTALACVLVALALAGGIYLIQMAFSAQPELAVMLTAVFLLVAILLPLAVYCIIKRALPTPAQTGFYLLLAGGLACMGIYFFWVRSEVVFPADILIWSESGFVTDLIRLVKGYPFFTAESLNESNIYPPGAPLFDFVFARLVGHPFSLPFYRTFHLVLVMIASGVCVFCTHLLLELGFPEQSQRKSTWWNAFWFTLLLLFATNSITNPFVHNLHNDALALLLNVLAFLWLLLFVSKQKLVYLILMVITPAVGFWVKQNLAVWVIVNTAYLLFSDFRHAYKRALLFGAVSAFLLGLSISVGYLLWKGDFIYWVFTVLSAHSVSPLRMVRNLLLAWPYAFIGLMSGLLLIWGKRGRKLLGLWLVWLFLFAQEVATSGIAWMLHHMGPASLIAGVWLGAAIYLYWPALTRQTNGDSSLMQWSRIGIITACFALFANGLGVLRIPQEAMDPDATRYIHQIEEEFTGLPTKKVLLDAGSWVYLKDQVIMQDRASSIGDRGFSGIADFSGIIERIQNQAYDKILLRKYLAPDSWYDNELWPHSSGINQALEDNYQVVHVIQPDAAQDRYLFAAITVLIPKQK
jgi:hypothetical protein